MRSPESIPRFWMLATLDRLPTPGVRGWMVPRANGSVGN